MKEDFLHYVWKFQKFDGENYFTSNAEKLHIKKQGSHNFNSGPDFFNAQIEIDGQLWAGNIEIHLKSSDWYVHAHETDPAYDSVILHVVWEHDAEIYRNNGEAIPTFVVGQHIQKNTLIRYEKLFSASGKWINCENDFGSLEDFLIENWLERLYFERLQTKQELLQEELEHTQNHWESLLFRMLCKNFGLKVNGESFFSIAKSVDFSIVKKCSQNTEDLEALLLGQASLLSGDKEDWYFKKLKSNYAFLKQKYKLKQEHVVSPKFFRLRPQNFPTVRLSQLAVLYSEVNNLFSSVIAAKNKLDFYALFRIYASKYWNAHYNFGIPSLTRKKRITTSFVDLIIMNTLIPIKFCYAKQHGKDISDELLALASEISTEKNSIIKKFNSLKKISKNAYQSQGLLQLKNEYCDKNKCLQCAIGNTIIGKEQAGREEWKM